MFHESITILAVNPGTKYFGIAVFESEDLVYWGIKVLKGKWCPGKMRSIETALEKLIAQYGVGMLALKKLHPSRSSRHLNCLVKCIERLAKKKRIRIWHYSLSDVKASLGVGVANKMALAECVVARYKFLANDLQKERKHKHPYFVRMFEAIAAGILVFNRSDLNKKR